nr:hypothetical protein [Tanacetum cinerariifolium]
AFLVTADVPEIYMQEFWATAIVHHHSISFKMNNKKHIINLETFRDMLHVCPRVPGQSFDELPFEAEILEFFRFLGHSDEIRHLTDIEHKKQKKGIEMYYPRFTKVIVHHFMSKDLSILRRNKVNWHYVRDDNIFLTIKVLSRHQNTQQYGAILPIELTNEDIRNTAAYKEYYACATGVASPKPKASARKKRGDSDTSLTSPIATPTPITTATPETHISQHGGSSTNEGTGSKPGVPDVQSDESEEEISWNSSDDEDVDAQDEGDKNDESDDGSNDGNDDDNDETVIDGSERDDDDDENDDEEALAKIDEPEDTESGRGGDEVTESEGESDEEETRQEEEESCDPIPRTPEGSKDKGNDEEDQDLRLSEEARIQEEEEADELYHDVDINQGRGLQVSQNIEDSHVTLTLVHPDGLQESSSVSSFVTSMLNPISDAGVESIFTTASSPIIEGNKSIQRSDEQRNLYKALVEAYDAYKTILDTYGESIILKRRREDDDQAGPSAGSDRGTPSETATGSEGRSTTGSQSRQLSASAEDQPIVQTSQHPEWFSQPKRPPTPDRDWNKTLPAAQGNAQSWISELARQTDARSSFNELLDTPIDFSNFIMNWLNAISKGYTSKTLKICYCSWYKGSYLI